MTLVGWNEGHRVPDSDLQELGLEHHDLSVGALVEHFHFVVCGTN
jgi:hypothetical protein